MPTGKDTIITNHEIKYDEKTILEAIKNYYKETVFITDGEGMIIFVNREAGARLHTDSESMMGKHTLELIKEGLYQYSTTMDAIKKKQPVLAEIKHEDNNHLFSHSVPILNEKNEVVMVVTSNMSVEHNEEWANVIAHERKEADLMRRELDYLRLQDQRVIVAHSPVMKNILSMIDAIAPTDSSVVLLGASGTGKDMMARLIHDKSRRAGKSYISINCAAIPDNLLESELFGYEPGSFSGALSKTKIGLFEAAAGGTLFLDEIGEMSMALQAKLLRVLENHEIRRVGGVKNINVDVRVICATNSELGELVEQKRFRKDLFYRLSVFTITLPLLKDRKEDIILIAENFVSELNKKYNKRKTLSKEMMQSLLEYDWPGNIRELRNVIERNYIITSENDNALLDGMMPSRSREEMTMIRDIEGITSLKDYMDIMEKQVIDKFLQKYNGNVQKTAERLGIHRSVLYKKIKYKNGK